METDKSSKTEETSILQSPAQKATPLPARPSSRAVPGTGYQHLTLLLQLPMEEKKKVFDLLKADLYPDFELVLLKETRGAELLRSPKRGKEEEPENGPSSSTKKPRGSPSPGAETRRQGRSRVSKKLDYQSTSSDRGSKPGPGGSRPRGGQESPPAARPSKKAGNQRASTKPPKPAPLRAVAKAVTDYRDTLVKATRDGTLSDPAVVGKLRDLVLLARQAAKVAEGGEALLSNKVARCKLILNNEGYWVFDPSKPPAASKGGGSNSDDSAASQPGSKTQMNIV